jgi:Methyltransferase FkbM domain
MFGFEPNPSCVISLAQGAQKQHPEHGDPLETKFIGRQFLLIPCALGISKSPTIQFFITKKDCGCSSLYVPKYFDIERIIEVPIFSFVDFFDLLPFDSHPIIDYIKIDAQGSDLTIVKSVGHYLAERVVYITLEPENAQYENTTNSYQDIDNYMHDIGFIQYSSSLTDDPTYFNPRFSDYVNNNHIQIYQKG